MRCCDLLRHQPQRLRKELTRRDYVPVAAAVGGSISDHLHAQPLQWAGAGARNHCADAAAGRIDPPRDRVCRLAGAVLARGGMHQLMIHCRINSRSDLYKRCAAAAAAGFLVHCVSTGSEWCIHSSAKFAKSTGLRKRSTRRNST